MWIRIANKSAKFHTVRLNRSENIRKRFRGGGYFFSGTPCRGGAVIVITASVFVRVSAR